MSETAGSILGIFITQGMSIMVNPKPNKNCKNHNFKLSKVEPFETNELHIGIVPSLTDHNHPANEIFRLISLMKAMIVA